MAGGVTRSGPAVAPGIWCERTVYCSVHADEVAGWTARAIEDPWRAVQLIIADARRLTAGLPGRAGEVRTLHGMVGEGRLGAVAALHRGEPCGLALHCAGTWVEWSATPVLFLPLARRTGPRARCSDGHAQGFALPTLR